MLNFQCSVRELFSHAGLLLLRVITKIISQFIPFDISFNFEQYIYNSATVNV